MDKRLTSVFLAGIAALGILAGGYGETKQAAAPAAKTETKQTAAAKGPLTLEYTYKKPEGMASNQMAAWIEDGNGKLIRTLFATKFTAAGGYKKRTQSLPVWVKKSGLAQLDSKKVDAFTQATPAAGKLTFTWDGKDDSGKEVPDGTYKLVLEGTLYDTSDALFTGTFTKGGKDQTLDMKKTLTKEPEKAANKDMITGVKTVYKGK